MSTLTDYQYAKYLAGRNCSPGLDALNCEGINFFDNGPILKALTYGWRKLAKVASATLSFIGDLFREDPSTFNMSSRGSHYDYPLIRGLR